MTFMAVLCAMGLVGILIIAYQKRIGGPVWFISIANLSDCLIQRLLAFKGKVLRVTLCGSLPKYFMSKNGWNIHQQVRRQPKGVSI